MIKNNFESQEAMYHDALSETNKVKSEYEAKLITSHDNFEIVQAENEILKEKVDVLFKLGRSYINNATKETAKEGKSPKKNPVAPQDKEPEIVEEITIDETEKEPENLDDLQAWSVHKMRGFKRVNPASNPSQNSPQRSAQARGSIINQQKETMQPSSHGTLGKGKQNPAYRDRSSVSNVQAGGESVYKGKYCHYFVNEGRCRYEERTGLKCKFEHKAAPMCNFGMRCSRQKCMFSHPNLAGTNHFLGRNYPMMNSGMNPWKMMNPWIQNPPNQYPPSPWINLEQQRYRQNQ